MSGSVTGHTRADAPAAIARHRQSSWYAKLEAYEGFCDQLGEQPAKVALAWLLANPVVTAPIVGPRTTQQLDESLQTLEIPNSPDTETSLTAAQVGGYSKEYLTAAYSQKGTGI